MFQQTDLTIAMLVGGHTRNGTVRSLCHTADQLNHWSINNIILDRGLIPRSSQATGLHHSIRRPCPTPILLASPHASCTEKEQDLQRSIRGLLGPAAMDFLGLLQSNGVFPAACGSTAIKAAHVAHVSVAESRVRETLSLNTWTFLSINSIFWC